MTAREELFARLRREPDVEARDLVAVDATDRLLLDEAAGVLAAAGPGEVVVVDDAYGALTLGAVAAGARDVRVHQDLLVGELALARNAGRSGLAGTYRSLPLGPELLAGARVVLAKAPRSLDALRELAELAAGAGPDVVLHVGGRVKHMTHAMNDALAAGFTDVRATLARQKSRVLVAAGPRQGVAPSFPRCRPHPDLGLTVCSHGAAFAGARVDTGTRALLAALPGAAPGARTALDLGCGTGVLAAALAAARPGLTVTATDQSAAAVASAEATLVANGLAGRVRVVRDDAAATVPDGSVDLVVCNPPFHLGPAVVTGVADRLFAAAGRVLRPGGELWCVYNNRLPHRATLRRLVGPTRVAAADRRFTVAVSTRR